MHSVKLLTAILIGAWAQDATARDITVKSGQSIQAAIDLASPGDRILVQPGTYREPGRSCPTDSSKVCAVVVSKNDISLVAQPRPGQPVVLENAGNQTQGIAFGRPGVTAAQCVSDVSKGIKGDKSRDLSCATSTIPVFSYSASRALRFHRIAQSITRYTESFQFFPATVRSKAMLPQARTTRGFTSDSRIMCA